MVNKKKQTQFRLVWFFFAIAAVAAGAYFLAPDGQKTGGESGKHFNVEKTGAGTNIDFTAASQQIHEAVDRSIAKSAYKVHDKNEEKKEVARQSVEGYIRWHVRQILVGVPADAAVDAVQKSFTASLQNAGGEVISSQPDSYRGVPAVRLDIGLKDKLGDEPLTVITDKVYIVKDKDIPAELGSLKPKPSGKERGQLAVIIDDFGYNQEPINMFAAMDRPLTFAVIPYRAYSNEAAARGLASGHQVILHLPMEPLAASEQSEPTTVTCSMNDAEIQAMASKAVKSIPGIIGVNNHQGSRATADARVMKQVLSVLKANHLFFVDSRTNAKSVAVDVARQLAVPVTANELFIDNDNDVAAIKKELRAAGEIVVRTGSAVIIGHARVNTAVALRDMIPELEAGGIKLVFVSQMVR